MKVEILIDTKFTRVIKIQEKVFKLVYINESGNNNSKYGFEINILLPDNTWKQVATELDTDFTPGCGTEANWEEKLKDKNRFYTSMILYIEKVFLLETEKVDTKDINPPIGGLILEIGDKIGKIFLDNNMVYDFDQTRLIKIINIHTKMEFTDIFIHTGMQLSDGAYLAQTITSGIKLGHTELILNGVTKAQKIKLLMLITAITDGAKIVKREV